MTSSYDAIRKTFPAPTVGEIGVPARQASVPCVYCHGPIRAANFVFWSGARRLLSADCRSCGRCVTLAAATWRRWVASANASGTVPVNEADR